MASKHKLGYHSGTIILTSLVRLSVDADGANLYLRRNSRSKNCKYPSQFIISRVNLSSETKIFCLGTYNTIVIFSTKCNESGARGLSGTEEVVRQSLIIFNPPTTNRLSGSK